jgi:putative ABC transport system substrate-binding protein
MCATPWTGAAAQDKVYRLAVISPSALSADEIRAVVFPELARLGFVEGRNLVTSVHVGAPALLSKMGQEVVALRPDVVIASTNAGVQAILQHSKSVPIVMAFAGEDPVAIGLAQSLSRPGGSVTGLTNQATELDGKHIALLHEAVPAVRRIAILAIQPPRHVDSVREMKRVAGTLGLETKEFYGHEAVTYGTAFVEMRTFGAEALAIASAPEYVRDAKMLARHSIEARLPTIGEAASMAHDGCLIGYGPDRVVFRRRAADFAARILRGTPPGEIPIEQPTAFVFAINLLTAKQLGLTIPPLLLARADEVIE